MWVKCVLVRNSQLLTSTFGLVNSSIMKMRLECRLHPSHSGDYDWGHIPTLSSMVLLRQLYLMTTFLWRYLRMKERQKLSRWIVGKKLHFFFIFNLYNFLYFITNLIKFNIYLNYRFYIDFNINFTKQELLCSKKRRMSKF